jgi:ATP-dependent Clp protease adapter protein ClpS
MFMDSTSITLTVLFSVIGAWVLWRINRMPALPATHPPDAAGDQSDAEDGIDVAYDLDLLCQIPAEYAGRTDLAQVVLVNDDTTPEILVAFILGDVFKLPPNATYPATLDAQEEGECVIAVLPREIAAERIAAARAVAEDRGGYLLQIITRPLPDEADQPAA